MPGKSVEIYTELCGDVTFKQQDLALWLQSDSGHAKTPQRDCMHCTWSQSMPIAMYRK